MLLYLFPEGLNSMVAINKEGTLQGGSLLTKLQSEFLKIAKVCFPPNVKVYIPKDECMSYNNIDLERRKLLSKVDFVMSDYERLYTKNENKCEKWEAILRKITDVETLFVAEFNHIKNYKEKIKTRDLDIFSNSRLQLIVDSYEQLNRFMKNSCRFIFFNSYL